MAGLPLKSGADFYNLEAARLRLHNLGADPTEVGAGLIYFNTSTGLNTSQKARLYTGNTWKTIAFSEDLDVASNADFLALKDRVDLLSGDVDTDAIISNMKEVSAFLEGFAEEASLMDYLNTELGKKLDLTGGVMKDGAEIIWGSGATKIWGNSNGLFLSTPLLQRRASSGDYHVVLDAGNYSDYALPKSGGILRDSWSGGTEIRRADSNNGNVMLSFSRQDGTIVGGLGFGGIDNPIFVTQAGGLHTLLHSGNVGDYNAGGAYKLVTSGGVTYASELQNALFFGGSSFSVTHLLGDSVTLRSGANSTVGLRLNSSGNVTIGASDLASTTTKLYVDGGIRFAPRTIWGQSFDGTGDISGNLTIGKQRKDYTTQNYLYLWKGDGTYHHRGMLYVSEEGASYDYYNPDAGIYRQLLLSPNGLVYNSAVGNSSFLINSSGNVIIGPSSSEQGRLKIVGADGATDIFYASDYTGNALFNIKGNGNVLIGTTTDNGERLQVFGNIVQREDKYGKEHAIYHKVHGSISDRYAQLKYNFSPYATFLGLDIESNEGVLMSINRNDIALNKDTTINGNLHVTGNIIADGEVSAGGRAEEGGNAGGGGAFHSESIAVGATQTTIAHGLGTDDIVVSIYEKDGVSGRWSLILTDVEVVDANNIIVSFGSATSVEHKVVIMGAVA